MKLNAYTIPLITFAGLVIGLIFHALNFERLDHMAWLITMFIGTTPLAYKILKDL